MSTSEQTVGQFGQLAGRIDRLVLANQAKIGLALDSATMALKDVRQSTQMVTKLLKDGKLTDQAMAMLTKLNETSTKATELVGNLNAMVTDPKLRDPLANTMSNVEKMTESGTKIAANGEKIAENGVVISANTVELTKKANEIADEAKTITKQIQKFLGGSLGGKKIDLQANLDIIGESRPRHYRTDIEGTINAGGTPIHFGLFDAFETNRITLQAGMPIHGGKGEIRYGVYASKPGLGVEYQIARGLSLRSDLFDVNNPRLDIRARYELGSGFYGWLGANSVFKRNALLLGFGFRK
jgi:phospholipid/cholesterol/gamma-HCH transport system substrate-binding protein